MFQSARPNSRAYIFFKSDPVRLEQGYVVNQPMVRPKYPLPTSLAQQQEKVVDITIKTDSGSYNFNGIPSNLDIADTFCNGESAVISDSRDAMSAEVLSTQQKSQEVLDSTSFHERRVASCKEIFGILNPEYADKITRDKEMDDMREKMDKMSATLSQLVEKLSLKTE